MKRFVIVFTFFFIANCSMVIAAVSTKEQNIYEKEICVLSSAEELIKSEEALSEIPIKTIKANETVRLYFPEKNSIEIIDTEEYIAGVLTGEMYMSAPEEALKAVAVAARTYTQYMCFQNKNNEYDLVADSSYHQAYTSVDTATAVWNDSGKEKYLKMSLAVSETAGEVLVFDEEIICALYHASSYPNTENCERVFVEKLPYLVGKNSLETKSMAYSSVVAFTFDEFNKLLKENDLPEICATELEIEVLKNDNGRCSSLNIQNKDVGFSIDGKRARKIFSLNSTSFEISLKENVIEFNVYGFGHGVGLSQNGAVIMAESGKSYEEILNYYYSGAEIYKTIYKN